MARLRPFPASRHASPAIFVQKDLHNCTRLPPSGRHAPCSGVPLQRPLPSPVSERENFATPCDLQATHRVNRQGQAGLHIQRGRLQEHRLQPCTRSSASHTTTGYTTTHFITASTYPHYAFWSSRPLSRTLQLLSNHLRRGGGGGQVRVRVKLRPTGSQSLCGNLPHERQSTYVRIPERLVDFMSMVTQQYVTS
jgi:hypothetical protein